MRQTFKLWLPVLLWMVLIFFMSTDFGSSEHTSRIIEPLLRWFNPNISSAAIDLTQTIVRKCGHFTEYAILAMLSLRAVFQSQRDQHAGKYYRAAGIALLIAASYAAGDEFHQSFIPTRTASIYDVLIDISGALAALVIVALWRKLAQKSALRLAHQATP